MPYKGIFNEVGTMDYPGMLHSIKHLFRRKVEEEKEERMVIEEIMMMIWTVGSTSQNRLGAWFSNYEDPYFICVSIKFLTCQIIINYIVNIHNQSAQLGCPANHLSTSVSYRSLCWRISWRSNQGRSGWPSLCPYHRDTI